MSLYLRYAVRSDLGLVRTNNEDSVYAGPRLLAIADGMGGHAAGEVASKIVISTMEHLDEDRRIEDLTAELRDTVVHANHRIADAVAQKKELEGMGTTLTALRFVGSQVGLVHVGDSRAYLMRNGELSQITHDDTYVQYLVDSGKLTPEEAKDHPRKSVILRALLGSDVEPSVSIREAFAGDRYLLCSDGLSDVVSAETIADTMQIEDPQEAADRLVELALRGGGPDNVTVIVSDVLNVRPGDHIDDVPVIAGAFVDPAAAEVPDTDGADSAAERAARMARPAAATAEPAAETLPPRRRRRWRPWLYALLVLVVLAGGLTAFYAWTQTQYFVSRDGQEVAIFQGVDTAFGPLKFYSVDQDASDLTVDELCPADRTRVRDGINASDRNDAKRIVELLRQNKQQACVRPLNPCPHSSAPTIVAPTTPSTALTTPPTARTTSHPAARTTTHPGTRLTHSTATGGTGTTGGTGAGGVPNGEETPPANLSVVPAPAPNAPSSTASTPGC